MRERCYRLHGSMLRRVCLSRGAEECGRSLVAADPSLLLAAVPAGDRDDDAPAAAARAERRRLRRAAAGAAANSVVARVGAAVSAVDHQVRFRNPKCLRPPNPES